MPEHEKKGGRPKVVPSEKYDMEEVEKLASLGLTDEEIGWWYGVKEGTINKYKKDPVFRKALKKGKIKADAQVVRALYSNAIEGKNVTAQIFWLKNRLPERWRDRREVTGKDGQPLVKGIEITINE